MNRGELMAEAGELLARAAAVETPDERRQAMFDRATDLYQRVREACPDDFAARRGVDTASSGRDVEQLIADGLKELHAAAPPPPASAAASLQVAQSAEPLPSVPWGGQPALVSTEPAVAARRQRLYKAATFFLSAQKLDPESVHAARRVADLCRATGLAITDELLLRWETEEVQEQLGVAERAQEIERVRSAHLRTISAKAWPDVRGDGAELRVFWSANESPRLALREWQHVRTAAAPRGAPVAGDDGAGARERGAGGGGGGRRRLTQHATLDQLCALVRDTRSGEVLLIKCGDGWIRLADGLPHPRAALPSDVVEILDVGAARGADPSADVEWLGQMLLDAICRHMPKTAVTLNVYDLGTESEPGSGTIAWVANRLPGLNSVLRGVIGGAFHGALEIAGTEYSFGWNDLEQTGVFECPDRQNEMHRFREAVPLGHTRFGEKEIEWLIAGELAGRWPGSGYDLLRRNCCHFCEEFAELLAVQSLPPWMSSLAKTGASLADTADKISQFKEELTRERSGGSGGGDD
jgi:hypothetical protein